MKKLFEIPNNTWIDVSHLGLINDSTKEPINTLMFKYIDGMYSICYLESGEIVMLKAWTEVKPLNQKSWKN